MLPATVLADEYGWTRAITGASTAPNLSVDVTQGVRYRNEVKDTLLDLCVLKLKGCQCCDASFIGFSAAYLFSFFVSVLSIAVRYGA